MSFFQQLNPKQQQVAKIVGLGFVALIVLTLVYRVGRIGMPMPMAIKGSMGSTALSQMMGGGAYDMAEGVAMAPTLSARNIAPMPPMPGNGGTAGNDAEAYETTSYRASIETRDIEKTCGAVLALKPLSYVVFEQANESERNCSFVFKVDKAHTEEVLKKLQDLSPRELAQDTQTIKRVVEDFTSETDILMKKKASIEATLETATKAYDDITALAVKTQDAETLSKVIESKLQVLERLTQERLQVNEQLDRLSRSKAQQLDRLNYTWFNVDVYENKFVDGQNIKDSWKNAVRDFVQSFNQILQDVSVGLIVLLLIALQYGLYFFIALFIVKYVWRWAKAIWYRK